MLKGNVCQEKSQGTDERLFTSVYNLLINGDIKAKPEGFGEFRKPEP
jgi:hypothetical protein